MKILIKNTQNSITKSSQLSAFEGHLFDWFPGETIYGLLSRHHQSRGHIEAVDTIKRFFGTDNGASLHENLSSLDVFVRKTGGRLGTPKSILVEHTLLRFYRSFMSERETLLLGSARPRAETVLKFPLNLWRGGFSGLHPHKACPECVENDLENFGVAYWHLVHQYPGVWVCLHHGRGLLSASMTAKGRQRFMWATPGAEEFLEAPTHLAGQANLSNFVWLGELITSKLVSDSGRVLVETTRARFRKRLHEGGKLTPTHKLRSPDNSEIANICKRFLTFVENYRGAPEFASMPDTVLSAHRLLSRYVNGKSRLKTLEHLLLCAWEIGESGRL
ncbi:TniQ family protein [Duganella sp. BJB476]|uniref:TniQ family protein n=1 Tax=Duganella sp. BJB476 TaxID=1871176 RepID=UPI000E351BD9|nr:TniQ family protein [Duganella sp. BJB476]RFP28742.1 hypothetical protein D0T21_20655 [Duganella sp. BJB476]